MRNLIGKSAETFAVPFYGATVEVQRLSVKEIREFQKFAKKAQKDNAEDGGIATQRQLIRLAVVGAADMTDEELDSFSFQSLADLTKEILAYNGLNSDESGKVGNEG
jgi:hypothetical protein